MSGQAATPAKPVRVMRARRSGPVACGHYVLAGAYIVKVDATWVCMTCRLEQVRELAELRREVAR